MPRAKSVLGLIVAIGAGLGAGSTWLPPVIWPDATVPAALAGSFPAARQRLWTEAIDGLRLPLHLMFIEARCNAAGRAALVFEEHRPPYIGRRYAYVVDGGSGGVGLTGPVERDDEFVHLMGTDTRTCP